MEDIGIPKWQERLNIVIDSAQSLVRFENSDIIDGTVIIKKLFSTIKGSVCAKRVMGFMDNAFQKFEPNEVIYAKSAEYAHSLELLVKMVRYQFAIQQLETKWNCKFEELETRYTLEGTEDFDADDDYLLWQWYMNAIYTIKPQIQELIGI